MEIQISSLKTIIHIFHFFLPWNEITGKQQLPGSSLHCMHTFGLGLHIQEHQSSALSGDVFHRLTWDSNSRSWWLFWQWETFRIGIFLCRRRQRILSSDKPFGPSSCSSCSGSRTFAWPDMQEKRFKKKKTQIICWVINLILLGRFYICNCE